MIYIYTYTIKIALQGLFSWGLTSPIKIPFKKQMNNQTVEPISALATTAAARAAAAAAAPSELRPFFRRPGETTEKKKRGQNRSCNYGP
jgi:hypothetical protein